jgi:hypothetical protein
MWSMCAACLWWSDCEQQHLHCIHVPCSMHTTIQVLVASHHAGTAC